MTVRERVRDDLRDRVTGETAAPVTSGPARRIWGTDGRLDHHHGSEYRARGDPPVTTTMTQAIARALLPISAMVGVAMLVKGYSDTGDGFSAGVILALGALTQVACFGTGIIDRIPLLRYAPLAAYAGILLALLIAFLPLLAGDPVFTHWPPPGASVLHVGTLEIITAVAFDLAVCLLVFGFVVGTITLLARAASVASMAQAQSASRRPSVAPRTARDHHPTDLSLPFAAVPPPVAVDGAAPEPDPAISGGAPRDG